MRLTRIDHGERTFETGGEFGHVVVELVAARDRFFQADDEQAVAFLGLFGDRFRLRGVLDDGRDVERLGVGLFFSLDVVSTCSAISLMVSAALLGIFFLGTGGGLAGLLVRLDLHDRRRHAAVAGDHGADTGGKFAVSAVVDGQ